ncbi:hypothetical protein C8Q79DRAFT_1105641 [Trametes meyenii]|nr:hypothetical protein C8Q79DRAFT_1105641 [Trametes meyenii]
MPPPAPIAAALQRILDEVPNLGDKHFENTYQETHHDITYNDQVLGLDKMGLSRSKPINMGYAIELGGISSITYTIWLLSPSDDVSINRRAFAEGLDYLINKAGPATLSYQVDVTALSSA